jgi:hypothetical protein
MRRNAIITQFIVFAAILKERNCHVENAKR